MQREKLEVMVLGLALRSEEDLHELLGSGLTPEHFAGEKPRTAFKALQVALAANEPVDLVALAGKLGFDQWSLWLVEATEAAPQTQNAGHYAKELKRQAWAGAIEAKADALRRLAHGLAWGDPGTSILEASQALTEMVQDQAVGAPEPKTMKEALGSAIEKVRVACDESNHNPGETRLVGIPTGLTKLNVTLRGFRPGAFYVLAARPRRGKTTLALNFALTALEAGKKVLYFTDEMLADDLAIKLLAKKARVNSDKLESGDLSEDEIDRVYYATPKLDALPLLVHDTFDGSHALVMATIEKYHRRGQVDLVVVDYLQQLEIKGEKFQTRTAELTQIVRDLKRLSLRLKIPVIGLAQVSRQGESSDTPNLRHLKDSGSLEQEADVVIFITKDEDGPGDTYLSIAKNRRGKADVRFKVRFDAGISSFSDEV
jgi:replicative DNA helicase